MRLFQKEKPNNKPKDYYGCANKIWQKVWELVEQTARVEECWIVLDRFRKSTTKTSTYDRPFRDEHDHITQ
jgi:hypothetical protein